MSTACYKYLIISKLGKLMISQVNCSHRLQLWKYS